MPHELRLTPRLRTLAAVFLGCLPVFALQAAEPGRLPWTTSRIQGTPEPPLPYTVERVFPGVQFENPVDMAIEPGSSRLYVLQLDGTLWSFLPGDSPSLVFDGRVSLPGHFQSYGITFHPEFEQNRHVFLSHVVALDQADGTHVARFEMTADDPPMVDPDSQEVIITWHSGGHNGGNLKFGPDGYLYVSAGDGGPAFPPDPDETGQDLGDLRATIFRIDVNHRGATHPYAIPGDNPFVGQAGAHPEIWAYGFRNPWKMSFDSRTGDLWAGDVGWELWELVYRVVKGGNYGWAVMEGRQPVRADVSRGPSPILPPTVDHPHTEARSITGGYVYNGERLSDLHGAYIYGDYVTGKIWGVRTHGDEVTWRAELADTPLAIITFGEDATGELYVVDYAGGIYRLIENPHFGRPSDFPRLLSETGLFTDTAAHQPAPGVYRYDLVAEPWMDGASADRFMALPGMSSITTARDRQHWQYPAGAVFGKSISLPDSRMGRSPQRLETQLLYFDGEQWRPYSYIWNDAQTDAELAPAEGGTRTMGMAAGVVPGSEGQQTWRIHSRAECTTCHTHSAGFTVGFFPQNLQVPDPATSRNQLTRLTDLELFAEAFESRDLEPSICDPYDKSLELESRARAYLMVNCAHCHRRGGGGTSHIEFPIEHKLDRMRGLDAQPTQGTFNILHARVIAPGDPFRSVLYHRVSTIGRGHMPQLGAQVIDEAGVAVLFDWIAALTQEGSAPLPPAVVARQLDESRLLTEIQQGEGGDRDLTEPLETLLASTTGCCVWCTLSTAAVCRTEYATESLPPVSAARI